LIDEETAQWLGAQGNNRYFADGFALKGEGRLLLVFEDYNYRTRKAGYFFVVVHRKGLVFY
jgi:hypothetical protein